MSHQTTAVLGAVMLIAIALTTRVKASLPEPVDAVD